MSEFILTEEDSKKLGDIYKFIYCSNENKEKPTFMTVVGQSGSGKTTYANYIDEIFLDGEGGILDVDALNEIWFESLSDEEKNNLFSGTFPTNPVFFGIVNEMIKEKKDVILQATSSHPKFLDNLANAEKAGYIVVTNVLAVSNERAKIQALTRYFNEKEFLGYGRICTGEKIEEDSKKLIDVLKEQEKFIDMGAPEGGDIINVWFVNEDGTLELAHTKYSSKVLLSDDNKDFLKTNYEKGTIKKPSDTEFKSVVESVNVGRDIDRDIIEFDIIEKLNYLREKVDINNENEVEFFNSICKNKELESLKVEDKIELAPIISLETLKNKKEAKEDR